MKRFDHIIEHWATIYKPMQHTPGAKGKNRRYFPIDSIVNLPQFMQNIPQQHTPCVAFEFQKEGSIQGGLVMPVYTLYFLVRVPGKDFTDKVAAADAVAEAELHAHKFLRWVRNEVKQMTPYGKQMEQLELKNVDYGTYGPLLNNWYAVFLQLRDTDRIDEGKCVDENDYITLPEEE